MRGIKLRSSFLTVLASLLKLHEVWAGLFDIPNSLYTGPVDVEYFAAGISGIDDGPKVLPRPNATTYDRSANPSKHPNKILPSANQRQFSWYFDVVSTSSRNESVTVIFFLSPESALSSGPPLLYVSLSGTWANGSSYSVVILPWNGPASSAIIKSSPDKVSGVWKGTDFSFHGSHGLKKFIIEGDNHLHKTNARITFDAVLNT